MPVQMIDIDSDDEIDFGKYEGETWSEIADSDPAYLVWCHYNVDWLELDAADLSELEDRVEQYNVRRAENWSNAYHKRRELERTNERLYGTKYPSNGIDPDEAWLMSDHSGYPGL